MKKASKALLLAAGIVFIISSILALGVYCLSALSMQGYSLFYIVSGVLGILVQQGVITFDIGFVPVDTAEIAYNFVIGGFAYIFSFVLFAIGIVIFIFQLIAGIIAFKGRGKKDQDPKKGIFIANFIFAGLVLFVFSSTLLSYIAAILAIVGSILGLISMKKEQQAEENPEEAQPEEAGKIEEIQ